ncbi:uncharacterized protein L969DRAFT_18271 [Mixia osmundae IAM 14324]|uniref:Sugar phosphate phosphatase n=1 Tax=Mixia osmundae (strain CBS 9802 / IAM 14324 / JCM 22182 / KY 12970) TaxID=764103 RepID=G7DZ39_MIXOS|nr:uncharacterized protein L969DRAFT_18271 [Mixia osmundae IAM 14324]KEI38250.1 hypothetical protein L969DRAFT_18271 [Mixia osmundae IAM 14324]GAA95849.1 hypothetical protein E5Q_02506 [Mixia osmundae IAM 14324]
MTTSTTGRPAPYSASDKSTFAYESTVKRWPTILVQIIDDIARTNHELHTRDATGNAHKIDDGKAIIAEIDSLRYEIAHDRDVPDLEPDGGANLELYNAELATWRQEHEGKLTWFSGGWLLLECYMYRRIMSSLSSRAFWNDYDPFARQKVQTLKSSGSAVYTLALALSRLGKSHDEETLHASFLELVTACLWGNATDLSLLTNMTHEDIQKLQSTGRDASADQFVLRNDLGAAWKHVKQLKHGRIDIILDNSGFELYTDLILACWLVDSSPFARTVVFHPKMQPWFVSDVLPRDFDIIDQLLDQTFFDKQDNAASEEERTALQVFANRLRELFDSGVFQLIVPSDARLGQAIGYQGDFWTNPMPFYRIPAVAPQLLAELQKSDLTIWKGDLNYRRLVGDLAWPTTTSWQTALGELAGRLDLLSLRTCKADVVVGLEEGTQAELDAKDPRWRISGKYAVISFDKRTV